MGNHGGEPCDCPRVLPGESSQDRRTGRGQPGAARRTELRGQSRGPGMPRQLEGVGRSAAEERALGIHSSPTSVFERELVRASLRGSCSGQGQSPGRSESRRQRPVPVTGAEHL